MTVNQRSTKTFACVGACGIKARMDTLYSLERVDVSSARACQQHDKVKRSIFKTIAIDTPGGNLNFVRNIKAQTTALNRAIT